MLHLEAQRGSQLVTLQTPSKTTPSQTCKHSSVSADMKRAVQAFARGFAAGYGLKVVVEAARHLLAALRLLLRRSVATVSVNGMTPALSQLLLNALLSARNARFGLFLGGALGTYRAVLALLQWRCRVAGNAELQPLHVVMAGSVAALAIVVDSGPEAFDRRRTLTLYAAAKSLQYLCQVLVARGTLPKIPSLPGWLFTIACGQIMFAWFYHPHTLPRSYRHWISLMANMDQGLRQALRDVHFGKVAYGTCPRVDDNLSAYLTRNKLQDLVPLDKPMTFLPRGFVHPSAPHSCAAHSWQQWRGGFLRSLLLYAPVHALPVLLFRAREIFGASSGPGVASRGAILARMLGAIVRSSAFLATFIASIWSVICLVRHSVRDDTVAGPLLGCIVCGTSIFIEKANRRMELSMYVAPRALDSALTRYFPKLWERVLRGPMGLALFCLSVGNIMYCYEFHPQSSIRQSVRALICQFVGRDDYGSRRRCHRNAASKKIDSMSGALAKAHDVPETIAGSSTTSPPPAFNKPPSRPPSFDLGDMSKAIGRCPYTNNILAAPTKSQTSDTR